MLGDKDRQIALFALTIGALPGVGPRAVQRAVVDGRRALLAADALDAEVARSLGVPAIGRALARDDVSWDALEGRAATVLERCEREGIAALHPLMRAYPRRLLCNDRLPPVLFVRGDASCLNAERAVSIVGTRSPTDYGAHMAERLAEVLAADGYVVVSGLALGSDAAGHRGALEAGGRTVAVLAAPVDEDVYPRANQGLAERIVEGGGALVSEYAPGDAPSARQLAGNLVARDEWQPGLSDGLIVVESSLTGGTRHALGWARGTGTPIAVFDYRSRESVDFLGDPRFGLNASCLADGSARPIFGPDTIEVFKDEMDSYRARARNVHWADGGDGSPGRHDGQLTLGLSV